MKVAAHKIKAGDTVMIGVVLCAVSKVEESDKVPSLIAISYRRPDGRQDVRHYARGKLLDRHAA